MTEAGKKSYTKTEMKCFSTKEPGIGTKTPVSLQCHQSLGAETSLLAWSPCRRGNGAGDSYLGLEVLVGRLPQKGTSA